MSGTHYMGQFGPHGPPQPITCLICNRLVRDHFHDDGTWNGCFVLLTPRALVLPEPRTIQQPYNWGWTGPAQAHEQPTAFQQPTMRAFQPQDGEGRSSRYRYRTTGKSAARASELRGQVKQVYILLSEQGGDRGLTAKEVTRLTGFKPSSVEHALWKLRHEGLAQANPA